MSPTRVVGDVGDVKVRESPTARATHVWPPAPINPEPVVKIMLLKVQGEVEVTALAVTESWPLMGQEEKVKQEFEGGRKPALASC